MKKVIPWLVAFAVAIGVVAIVIWLRCGESPIAEDAFGDSAGETSAKLLPEYGQQSPGEDGVADGAETSESDAADATESEDGDGESESEDDEEEKLVNAFDDLTDSWTDAERKPAEVSDIAKFVEAFRRIPDERKDECVHRALNLIPDEHVMLLAGILMDKSIDGEIVQTVFNDILNREDEVKKPILQEIFKDKSHSCWADVAWILDVTGELPKPEKK